jgi:hypothetical protein
MKKHLLICLCAALFALTLTACGGKQPTANFHGASGGAANSVTADIEGDRPVAPGVSPNGSLNPTAAATDGQKTLPGLFAAIPDSSARKITADEAINIANIANIGDAGDNADSPVSEDGKPFVAMWHASPVLGSGWNKRLMLAYDGSFVWAASQMDEETRIRYLWGTWGVSGGSLTLETALMLRRDGGRLVDSNLTISGKALEGFELAPYAVSEKFTLPITTPEVDPDILPDREMYAITVSGEKYWYYAEQEVLDEFWEVLYSLDSTAASTPGEALSDSDKAVLELGNSVISLLKNKDWGALGSLVHPEKGLTFSPFGFVDTKTAVKLGAGDVKALGFDDTVRTWGVWPSDEPIEYAFAEYYEAFIFDHDFTKATQSAVNRIIKSSEGNNLNVFGNGGAYVEFHIPGVGTEADFNWASLRLVFSWYDDDTRDLDLFLVAIVHDSWTP